MTADATGHDEWIGIDNIVVACFVRGTLIRTPSGELPVETLLIGEEIITLHRDADGSETEVAKPIKWIGRRGYSTRFLARDSAVTPVLIRTGALGEGLPRQDLRVSPEHAMLLDNILIPAVDLVDGRSIVRELEGDTLEYFHIELAEHGILFANGAPAETYVNHGNRKMFANWPEYACLYGDDAPQCDQNGDFVRSYPCVRSGPQLQTIRCRLEERSKLSADAA